MAKKDQFESILQKSVILYKSQKKQTYLAAIKMQFVVTGARKALYCVKIVSDRVRKVSHCVEVVPVCVSKVSFGVRKVSDRVKKV